jgi:hypothetical protein
MQFKQFVNEMTFSAGQQDFHKDPDFADSKRVGEFNGFEISQNNNFFFILKDKKLAGWVKISTSPHGEVIEAIRILPEFRRQHLAENFLFWLKSYLKKNIIFGDTMSDDAILWLKWLASTGRFSIFWLNIRTGEKHFYDGDKDNKTLKPYRHQLEPTDWRVLFEAYRGDFFQRKYPEWNELGATTDLFS